MKKYTNKFFCFSPPVMIATFAVEIILACYVLWRYKLTRISRLVVLILLFLAIFQLAEFMICGGLGLEGIEWARIGYVAITLLPPLGIHLGSNIIKSHSWYITWGAYALAAVFIIYFTFASQSITGQVCRGNYVIFDMASFAVGLYTLYYYGLLFAGISLFLRWAKQAQAQQAKALRMLAVGYGAFILPTATANILDVNTIAGIPSIMCGFAVFFAFILVGWVVPGVVRR